MSNILYQFDLAEAFKGAPKQMSLRLRLVPLVDGLFWLNGDVSAPSSLRSFLDPLAQIVVSIFLEPEVEGIALG